jgi:dihydrofolate synthase/folylpolyglutamate synthase
MTYDEAIHYLYDLQLFGAKFGLQNTFKLAALAHSPQVQLRFIHVAGTNGKGSTCALLESIYRKAGLKVGLFTSPHLIRFGERIQVNREPISEADIVKWVSAIRRHIDHPSWTQPDGSRGKPTFFEAVTVLALLYFADRQCDVVIWEAGLGGRLDATNIVEPIATVITNVQFDHEKWLGDTLEKIASEKAGIVKLGIPIVTGVSDAAALDQIALRASQCQAPFVRVVADDARKAPLDTMELPLKGEHQRINAAVALATVRALHRHIPVSDDAIREGLRDVRWPGRFQIFQSPGRTVICDGAHNPSGVETCVATLTETFPGAKPAVIIGLLRDKDWAEICRLIAPVARRVVAVRVRSERSVDPADASGVFRKLRPELRVDTASTIREALEQVRGEELILVTGSLYFIGETLEELAPAGVRGDERKLNEWMGT